MGRSYTSGGAPIPFDFELDGVPFVAAGGVQVLELSELALHAEEDIDSPAGMAAMALVFRHALGDEEYERFRRHCREHSTGSDTLLEIMKDMSEQVSASPTQPSGQSSPGRQSTAGTWSPALPETQPLSDEDIARYRAAIVEAERTRSPG